MRTELARKGLGGSRVGRVAGSDDAVGRRVYVLLVRAETAIVGRGAAKQVGRVSDAGVGASWETS